jgi:hypothetical protein
LIDVQSPYCRGGLFVDNGISKDMILKKKAFKLMEDATKRGYWATHSIVFNKRHIKTLIIEITENQPCEERKVNYEQEVLDIIKDNPGIQTKTIYDKLSDKMCIRNLRNILRLLREKELILAESVGKSKSDPTRQYYLRKLKLN